MVVDSILWRRLDTVGHDACYLEQSGSGWALHGVANFRQDGVLAGLAYQVACDLEWRTQKGRVRGWIGERSVDFTIVRTSDGMWAFNGTVVSGLESCTDLDLGFTPATNVLPVRRLNLTEGQTGDAPAAWFDVSAGSLEVLPQSYERRTENTYWYEAPGVGYAALLEVAPSGLIRSYPDLWQEES